MTEAKIQKILARAEIAFNDARYDNARDLYSKAREEIADEMMRQSGGQVSHGCPKDCDGDCHECYHRGSSLSDAFRYLSVVESNAKKNTRLNQLMEKVSQLESRIAIKQ